METKSGRWRPTVRDALWAVAFGVAFIVFRWWEFGFVLRRGDYAAAGPHTWYWTWSWIFPLALFLLFVAVRWAFERRTRGH